MLDEVEVVDELVLQGDFEFIDDEIDELLHKLDLIEQLIEVDEVEVDIMG